jgi:hypothetical protein
MRRFTRLTNGFSKKLENHVAALALYFVYDNFVRVHQSLRITPAIAAGVTDRVSEIADMVRKVERREEALHFAKRHPSDGGLIGTGFKSVSRESPQITIHFQTDPLPNPKSGRAMNGSAATPAPAKPEKKGEPSHFPSLNGIRAVSILMVMAGHLNGTVNFGRRASWVGDYAHLGVVVFFVVSGFLITSLLLSEEQKRGRVSLKLFYARRSLRIFPASYAYLACMSGLWIAGAIQLNARSLWQAVTYTMNYMPRPPWHLGHL